MNTASISVTPDPSGNAHVRAGSELRSLMARRLEAAKKGWVWALLGLFLGSAIIGVATSLPFMSLGWPVWAAILLGLFFHLLAAFAVHWWRSHKGREEAISTIGLVVFVACCLAFLGLALWRSKAFLVMGVGAPINYVLSIGLWLFEVAVPLGLGTMFAAATHRKTSAAGHFGFFDDFARNIAANQRDADGLWGDKEMSVDQELHTAETKLVPIDGDSEKLRERLRLLYEYRPFKRFDDPDRTPGPSLHALERE